MTYVAHIVGLQKFLDKSRDIISIQVYILMMSVTVVLYQDIGWFVQFLHYYRKFPKYSDTPKNCCNHSKI